MINRGDFYSLIFIFGFILAGENMAESKFNLSDSSDRVNPLVIGAAVIGGVIIGAVVAVRFFSGQSVDTKKTIETPIPTPHSVTPTATNSSLISGLEQQLAQAKQMQIDLEKVKTENETQKSIIQELTQKNQNQESSLNQKDKEIAQLKTKSSQQAEELTALTSKFSVVKEENESLKNQVEKYETASKQASALFQSVHNPVLEQTLINAAAFAPVISQKNLEPTVVPQIISTDTNLVSQPQNPSTAGSDHSGSEKSLEQSFSATENSQGDNSFLAKKTSQSVIYKSTDRELNLNPEKNAIIQTLAEMCRESSLNENEVYVARYLMVLILLYKNQKNLSEIFGEASKTVCQKLTIATDLPQLNNIFVANSGKQDEFKVCDLTADELKLFSDHFRKNSEYLPNDATAVNLFGDLSQLKKNRTLKHPQTTLDQYNNTLLARLKPTTNAANFYVTK